MADQGIRNDIRKALRDYDNPKGGRNPNYLNSKYLQSVLEKYSMGEDELRAFANSVKYGAATMRKIG